jgi:hypothetical protein
MAARLLLLAPALLLVACGSPEAPKRSAPRRLENRGEIAMHKEESATREQQRSGKAPPKTLLKQPAWQREAPPMPAAFAERASFDLATLEGVWLVASDIPGQRELWLIEEQGRKLTIVDKRGNERLHGLALLSPCSLQISDDKGRTHARSFARVGERLLVHPKAGVGLRDDEGLLIACVGSQAFTVDRSGKCSVFAEALGVWSEQAETCEQTPATPEHPASVRLPVSQRSRGPERVELIERIEPIEHGTIWSDPLAEAQAAERFADRAAAERALAANPKLPEVPASPSEPEPSTTTDPQTTTDPKPSN